MINGIGEVSAIQINRAQQAFKSAAKYSANSVDKGIDDSDVTLSLSQDYNLSNSSNSIDSVIAQKKQYISEVKNFANQNGLSEINDNEISYALKYGRSILVDQTA